MSQASKALYKPLALGVSVAGGMLAGTVFQQVWRRLSNDESVPDPQNLNDSTPQVLAAAALHGLVFGLVKAAVDRAGAKGYRKLTRDDPK